MPAPSIGMAGALGADGIPKVLGDAFEHFSPWRRLSPRTHQRAFHAKGRHSNDS